MQSVMTPGSATEGVGETEDRKSRMPKIGPMQVTLSLHRKVREQGTDHPRVSSAVLLAKVTVLGVLADAS
jgi:hypothetical protein